jgi:hypothetical protein
MEHLILFQLKLSVFSITKLTQFLSFL